MLHDATCTDEAVLAFQIYMRSVFDLEAAGVTVGRAGELGVPIVVKETGCGLSGPGPAYRPGSGGRRSLLLPLAPLQLAACRRHQRFPNPGGEIT